MPPSWGANAMLYPSRRAVTQQPRQPFTTVDLEGAGVRLKGWWFHGTGARGTVVYLHGVGDNRGSSVGIADHFLARGFDVVAYDSRAHGESGGAACTYGFYEKEDLRRVLDRVTAQPIVLMGVSMGAAVALQEAAEDPRIAAVVAIAPFSDLRTAAVERAPFFASTGNITAAFSLAERDGKFRVDDVSPQAAAARIRAPTLIIHGAQDRETPPAHSQRIFAALPGPKRLVLVPDAGHNDVINAQVWRDIDDWLAAALARRLP
jgi:alpha-beta hydrolase superfamily lysophospholipase